MHMNDTAGNDTTEPYDEVSALRPETMPIVCIYCFLVMLGNGLTIASVFRFEQLRTPTNLLVASLAGADLSVGIVVPYFTFLNSVSMGVRLSQTSRIACLLSLWGILLWTLGSVFNLLAVAVDRFLAIRYPLRYPSIMTLAMTKAWIIAVWSVTFCLTVPPVCGWNNWTDTSKCTFSDVMHMEYITGLFAAPVVVCLCALTCLYGVMFCVAWKHRCQIQVADPTTGYSAMRGHLRSAKTMGIVLGTFYICWCPYIILTGLTASYGSQVPRLLRVFRDLAAFLTGINSGLNPCIYAWRSADFRKAYVKLICFR